MLTTLKVKAGERQFYYIDQVIGGSHISVNSMVLRKEKLSVDILLKHVKWKSDVMEGI